jgi:DNA-binding transcriptional regulator YiaG
VRYTGRWTADGIRWFRKKLGLNQAEFAKVLGVARSTVSRWEWGHSAPSYLAERHLGVLYKAHVERGE